MTQQMATTSNQSGQDSKLTRALRVVLNTQEFGVFLILVLLCVFLSLTTDTFLTSRNILTVLLFFSWIAIAAFGETMVILTAGIDLSVGSAMALTGFVAAWLLVYPPLANNLPVILLVILAVLGGLLVGIIVGLINGKLITRFRLPPFIATLGMMSIARGLTYGGTQGWPVRGLPKEFSQIGQANITMFGLAIPLPIIIMFILAIICAWFLGKTVTGRHIYAVGGNEEAVRVSGVNPNHIKMIVYTAAGLLAGIAGIINTAKLSVAAPTAALGWELDVIAAVVIGGTSLFGGEGTILGTLIGAAIMGVIRNGLNLLGFPAYWQPAAIGAVIILAVIFDQWRRERG